MQVGMQIIANITKFLNQVSYSFVIDKFLLESVAFGGLVVCLGDVRDGDALRTILCTYPVGIWEVDTNGCRPIGMAA